MLKKILFLLLLNILLFNNVTYSYNDYATIKKSMSNIIPNHEEYINTMDKIVIDFNKNNSLEDIEIYINKISLIERNIKWKNKKIYFILQYLRYKLEDIRDDKKILEITNSNLLKNNLKSIENDISSNINKSKSIYSFLFKNINNNSINKDYYIKQLEEINLLLKEQLLLLPNNHHYIKDINNNISKNIEIVKKIEETNLKQDLEKIEDKDNEIINNEEIEVNQINENVNIVENEVENKKTNIENNSKVIQEENNIANLNSFILPDWYYYKPLRILEKNKDFEKLFNVFIKYRNTDNFYIKDNELYYIDFWTTKYLDLNTNYSLIEYYNNWHIESVEKAIKDFWWKNLLKGEDYKKSRILWDDIKILKLNKDIFDKIRNIKLMNEIIKEDIYWDPKLTENNNLLNSIDSIYKYAITLKWNKNIVLQSYLDTISTVKYNYKDINKKTNHSWLTTFSSKTWVCDWYSRVMVYILLFNNINDIEIIKWDAYTLWTSNKVAHAWLKIWNLYFDPTFDDPLKMEWNNTSEHYVNWQGVNDLMYYWLPLDIISIDRNWKAPLWEYLNQTYEQLSNKYKDYKILDYIKTHYIK